MFRSVVFVAGMLLVAAGCSQQQNSGAPVRTEPVSTQTPPQAEPAQQSRRAVIWVSGLSCPLCVQAIKQELWKVPGVGQIDIDYAQEMATVELTSRKGPSRGELEQAIQRTGYTLAKLEMR